MGARQVCNQRQMFERICVVIEHCANFIHIGNAIVILGAKGKAVEGVECRDANCIKVPPTEILKKELD